MTFRVTMATFMGNKPGWNIPEFPVNSPHEHANWGVWLRVGVFSIACGRGRWRGERCKTCVCHAGSFLALTSVSTTWGWWDIYRACGVGGVRLEGGQAPWLLHPARMCRNFCIFNMWCVWGGAYEHPNIFLADFLSAAFSKLCIRFILSWMKRSFQYKRRLVLTNLSFRHKH